jgi:glycine hydroxymethyltransferase
MQQERPPMIDQAVEVHDPVILARAREILDACSSARDMQQAVLNAVKRNELASEVGIRAAEGHIGAVNRWFMGTQHIDEIEALCMELLKRVFRARYADHRLMGGMLGNLAVYATLAQPGDVIMSVAQPLGRWAGTPAIAWTGRPECAASRS